MIEEILIDSYIRFMVKAIEKGLLTKDQIDKLKTTIAEWYSIHWRDDDNPKSEYRASREMINVQLVARLD